jgi:hypothetical protein
MSTVTQTPTETLQPPASLPYDWPITPLTDDQIAAVRGCNIMSLANQRYSSSMKAGAFSSTFEPRSACDWAVLAFAYAESPDSDGALPQAAKDAFSQAVARNPGFVFATALFSKYFGTIPLAKIPPFAQQEITDVKIRYEWDGLGPFILYTLEIHHANTDPVISARPDPIAAFLPATVDKKLVQAFRPAMIDFVPVESSFSLFPCVDNYPSWQTTLTFADHTSLTFETASNFLSTGGPWFVSINGQLYSQVSTAFSDAVENLISSLHLPPGEPATILCSVNDEVFGRAFPVHYNVTPESRPVLLTDAPTPARTAPASLSSTDLHPLAAISGIFASREKTADGSLSDYEIIQFYNDGTVLYASRSFSSMYGEWPEDVYSRVSHDWYPVCRGKYEQNQDQIKFSVACEDLNPYPGQIQSPVGIDYSGIYAGGKLILDSYSHPNGLSTKQRVFLPIEDPSLKP